MGYWNGTRLKTSWLRLRGNASGRTRDWRYTEFFCDGCQRTHGRRVDRFVTLDKRTLCTRQYNKHLNARRTLI